MTPHEIRYNLHLAARRAAALREGPTVEELEAAQEDACRAMRMLVLALMAVAGVGVIVLGFFAGRMLGAW